VLRDWADGGLDRAHRPACYRQALKSLPADLRVYSSAPDDIRNALAARVADRATRKLASRGVAGARYEAPAAAEASGTLAGLIVPAAAAGSLAFALAVALVRRR
jgi:hypothetical protein